MKRITLLSVVLLAFVMSATAGMDKDIVFTPQEQARDFSGWYIGAFGGATLAQEEDYDAFSLEDEAGGIGGLQGGYQFDRWGNGKLGLIPALEMEAFYVGVSPESLKIDSIVETLNFVLNIDIDPCPLRPYVGGGIGDHYTMIQDAPGADDSLGLAWQGFAGMEYELNHNWYIYAEYKYIGLEFVDEFDYIRHQSVVGGINYKF